MDTRDNMNEENEPRPRFLTVLCILTFIATGLGLISGLFNLLITGKQSEEAMINSKVAMAQSINEMRDMGMTSFVDLMEKIDRMSVEVNENFYFVAVFGLIVTIIGLYSALKMWKGSKLGFHIYIIYNLISIGGIYLYVSPANIPTIFVVFNVILSGIFILMYSRNLKWLK
jgi:uncharacterized membrane protein YagU involved in acid resistance